MVDQTELWQQTLYKALDDSEVTQTIVIFEDDAAAFRVVQLYELKRYRTGKTTGVLAPRATYCRDSVCESKEMAMLEAQRLIAKCVMDNWRVCRDEQTAQQESGRSFENSGGSEESVSDCLKMYVVFFSDAALGFQIVIANSCRVEGQHLVFFTEDGKLAALFLLESVKRWSSTDIVTA
jgi:hypothetical protein